jgi:hypothetical protein
MPVDVVFNYDDNNGNRASHKLFLADGLSASARNNFISALSSACEAITLARLQSGKVTIRYAGSAINPPGFLQSNVYSRLVLFFRNSDEWDFIRIPAPTNQLPYDASGAYRSYRLTSGSVLSSPAFAGLLALTSQMVRYDGSPFPQAFFVGCRTLGGI